VETKPRQFNLFGYYWNKEQERVVCKIRGLDSFCNQIDLLTLHSRKLGKDALETVFFKEIDNKGATVRDFLVQNGPDQLTAEQRSEFARLILSLEARRPINVQKLKGQASTFVHGLDNDPNILEAMKRYGFEGLPSDLYLSHKGTSYEDHALSIIEKLVDNKEVGGKLINSIWLIVRVGVFDGSFLLGDRPVIRTFGYDHPNAIWALPLSPKIVFLAANQKTNAVELKRMPVARLVKAVNKHSVGQAERFVFATDASNAKLLAKGMIRL
jgi:hypothetical protein